MRICPSLVLLQWHVGSESDYAMADIREKFRDYMQEYSPVERPFYGYLTSVVVRRLSRSRARSRSRSCSLQLLLLATRGRPKRGWDLGKAQS